MHHFLILHVVKKSGQIFFIRLDCHPRTQNLLQLAFTWRLTANDHVGLRIVAIPDGILTAYILHSGKVGTLEWAAIGQAKIP